MKKAISITAYSLLFIVFFSVQSISQNSENNAFNSKKTEFNIAIANIFAKANLVYPYYYLDGEYISYTYGQYLRQPELVLGVKFHGEKGAFRLGTSLKYSNITDKNIDDAVDTYTIKNTTTSINIGYEWHTVFSRVVFFYGFDISTSYAFTKMEREYAGNYPYGLVKNDTKVNETTFGINPLAGVNVFITPNLSIGTEVKFTAEYVSGKSEYNSNNSNSDGDKRESSGFRTRIGPVGFLSINIHF